MTTMILLSLLTAVAFLAAAVVLRRGADGKATTPAVSTATVPAVSTAGIISALPDSLSALVYVLPQGRWRWLWSLWLAVVTLLVAPALMLATSASWWASLLAAATVVCLAMTAALPLLPGYHNRLHNALGIAAGILSQLCVAAICPWWLLAWLLVPALLVLMYLQPERIRWIGGKGVLLTELLCAAALYGSLLTA